MKISIISASKAHAEAIKKVLQDDGAPESWRIAITVAELDHLAEIVELESPNLLVLDNLCNRESDLHVLERLSLKAPSLSYLLLCHEVSQDFLISAMRYGVRDVLKIPVAPGALRLAIERIEQKAVVPSPERKKGKLIGLIGCKGGSGATFIAANLAYMLAAQGESVALFDMNLQFGDAVLFVSDRQPEYNLSDVTGSNISRLDASYLNACMLKVLPNFGVLAAPEDPGMAMSVRPEHIEVLFNLARSMYDYVIVDVGRVLNAATVKALDHADVLMPVLQQTLPFIRDAKRIVHTLMELGNSRDKIRLIVNRHERGGDIEIDDIERTLGMKVYKAIPNSYKAVSASVNQGIPILKIAANDPVTRVLHAIVGDLTEGEAKPAKSAGWFSKWTKSG